MDWSNDECITIHVAKARVSVKFGDANDERKYSLFYVEGETLCRRTAVRLGINYKHDDIPIGMEDPMLTGFTLAALESKNIDEYYLRLLVADCFAKYQGV